MFRIFKRKRFKVGYVKTHYYQGVYRGTTNDYKFKTNSTHAVYEYIKYNYYKPCFYDRKNNILIFGEENIVDYLNYIEHKKLTIEG